MTDKLVVCSRCKTSNRPNARYCSNCGTVLESSAGRVGFVQLSTGRLMHSRYTIERPLGKGGMGAVYLASETIAHRKRRVVIKEMLEYFAADDPEGEARAKQRFESEAATLVSLNFAGIPQIFDFFSQNGRNYIVMQFIEGRNLESGLTHIDDYGNTVAGNPYPADQVRGWGRQLCKVLENLADQNVIHMDIKPANLILDRAGDVWLVDFGTAKAQWVTLPGGKVGMQKSSVYGTAGYAPPEQYTGKVDSRSDVYALAATLYHLLTDDDPRAHPFSFPRLNELPPDLATALERSLAREVSQRVDASQFRRLLDIKPATGPAFRWKDGLVSHTPKDLASGANLHWNEARGYFLSGAWENWFKSLHRNDFIAAMSQAKQQNQEPDIALDAFLRLLDGSMARAELRLSRSGLDAGTLTWGQKRDFTLEIQNTGSGWLRGRFVRLPEWVQVAPEAFGFHRSQEVHITVNTRKLPSRRDVYTDQLFLDAGSAGQAQIPAQVAVLPPSRARLAPRKPRAFPWKWIAAGLALIVLALVLVGAFLGAFTNRSSPMASVFMPLAGNTIQHGLLFTSNRDGKMEIYRLTPETGVERVTRSPGNSESWSALPDANGDIDFVSNRDGKSEIYRLSSDGVQRVTNTPDPGESWFPVSVSRNEMLFVSTRDGKREIYRLNNNGIERVTYTPGRGESWYPTPAPGGGILFVSTRDGKREIYRLESEGVEQVTHTPGNAESWAPVPVSGGEILFVSDRDGKQEIYRLTSEGVERVTHTPGNAGSWSPLPETGGILFVSNRDAKLEIYRLTSEGVKRVTYTPAMAESWLLWE
jgi:serine/threonine protein kinase/Tol biopolymer transport system component